MPEKGRERGDVVIMYIPKCDDDSKSKTAREDKILKVKKEEVTDISEIGPDLPNGDINWDCSCMGSLPFGPCGTLYRRTMECMRRYEYARKWFH